MTLILGSFQNTEPQWSEALSAACQDYNNMVDCMFGRCTPLSLWRMQMVSSMWSRLL